MKIQKATREKVKQAAQRIKQDESRRNTKKGTVRTQDMG